MKELIRIIVADLKNEGFTKRELMKYGIVAPLLFAIRCIVAGKLQ